MKLRYTPAALAELDEVLGNIALQSPKGAKRIQARLHAVINLLLEHPLAGVATDERPMRRIVVRPYPYLIYYEPSAAEIVIVGIRHGARDPSTMPDK
ncbi:type II toxin-antitoxin system RelE/ParE family toxin [Mesorhizobium sp. CA15]|uniref:type II toxin-antitoxin system RelE/ParE family toxin n=1 Tax=unclassified Mesorhizobium TaxID=325217 RepID=UPI001CCFD153|nr:MULTISPECIES: type II toxin-antitoxin system RelE/ParE family toxin [unclassified Mesorhizobium]MBZ9812761.1 type II toxin-antitoxin system RelE/ParE family toxin [Mesorhizobium sp. CA7]MBZ9845439.1 type II toxin-antitoxin system RelE/ParE family toxin [Mesorhizobium sp. CA5]MBZ9858287.1 type II toxin-antitoxin system RelE/ParE family toxin [Mesorhizobium sp. CA12]MBZ9867131.1 type II toxin-antitoxin system RelE/ParE family toxin [Mesorhizobium sp. CA15]